MTLTRYYQGDWVKYRNDQAIVTDGKILEKRPDGYFVIGSHDNDPNPDVVDPDKISGYVDN